ncbi:hypothetical protein [Paludibaculum fermentans]|uniref:Uncharacterized protein n=1 Tax=Paludibaculum fermentans TaxID=1473598 RepID=A0A7S7SMM4_PALFE|nr:hypothetical protein [Paludibaculum fermentans]QOY89646.1 hypothetical protein IRI77_06750 [Paludibaculum fermentans]
MRLFFSRHIPHFRRVLLVESGSRYLVEGLLPSLYAKFAEGQQVDLVTCFPGVPKGFDASRGRVHRVTDYIGSEARTRFYSKLRAQGYEITGIICSGEPIMTKWKWVLAWQVQAKVFILNENGDYFWFQKSEWRTIKHFILFRAGLSGSAGISTVLRVLLFPFTFTYLLLCAAYYHLRRIART